MRNEVGERDWRVDPRAANWAGYALAERLKLDIGAHTAGSQRSRNQESARQRVSAILKAWTASNALRAVKRRDEEARKDFEYFAPGFWSGEGTA